MKVVIELSEKELQRLMILTAMEINEPEDAEDAIHLVIEYA